MNKALMFIPWVFTVEWELLDFLSIYILTCYIVFGVFCAFPEPWVYKTGRYSEVLSDNKMIIYKIICNSWDVLNYLYINKCYMN